MMDPACQEVEVRPIRSRLELERALALVHDNYVRCGYIPPHPSGMRMTPFLALPTTQTYVAIMDDDVVATLTLHYDSEMSLPADAVFGRELAALRRQGRRLLEVGLLADRRRALQRSMSVLLRMMKRVFWAGRLDKVDDVVATVRPRHAPFYRRLLCFDPISPVKPYAAVANVPVVLLRADLTHLDPLRAENPQIRELFLQPLTAEEKAGKPFALSTEDLQYFVTTHPEVFLGLDLQARSRIERHHPAVVWPEVQAARAVEAR